MDQLAGGVHVELFNPALEFRRHISQRGFVVFDGVDVRMVLRSGPL